MTDEERIPATQGSFWPRVVAIAVLLGVVVIVAAAVTGNRSSERELTIPPGATIVAALENTVSTKSSPVGNPVTLITREPTLIDTTTLPAGIILRGEVTHAKGGGRIAGAPELTLRFTRMEIDGREYPVSADPFRVRGKDDLAESALTIGGGAVAGGVVGAITGSAAKGAVVGAVLGTGVAVATEGDQIVLPAGQKIRVRLSEPVTIKYQPPVEQ